MISNEIALRTAIADFPTEALPLLAYVDYLQETDAPQDKILFYQNFTEAFIKGKRFKHKYLTTWYLVYFEEKIFYVQTDLDYRIDYDDVTTYDNIFSSDWLPNLQQASKYEKEDTWVQF